MDDSLISCAGSVLVQTLAPQGARGERLPVALHWPWPQVTTGEHTTMEHTAAQLK